MSERPPLAAVPQAQRDAILEGPRDTETHAQLLASLPFASALDIGSFADLAFPRSEPQASGEAHEAAFPRSEPTASGEIHKARVVAIYRRVWN